MWRIEKATEAAAELRDQNIVVGRGTKRMGGTIESDYKKLGEGINKVNEIARKYGLIARFHHHLGTCIESLDQIDKVM